ncbi:hypothetical protein DBT_2343 [Dissulfuribacter thermophilus]|uniref:Uncharacterized protein n=1 Tax=Dissulfuribacter thermophilus TaxID=1156395 RepID=A0A1B9F3C9_9BACT|nr:hypothetical protein DBT_2343 [Dissulfuribacter thermophilus]
MGKNRLKNGIFIDLSDFYEKIPIYSLLQDLSVGTITA